MMIEDSFHFKCSGVGVSKKLECCCDVFIFSEQALLELKRIIIAECERMKGCLPRRMQGP
jgi:hypothetical protein